MIRTSLLALLLLQTTSGEVIEEIRVHGNLALSAEEIIQISGVATGDPLEPDTITHVEESLVRSRKFEKVEVSKRYRSLTRTDAVVLVINVHEKPQGSERLMISPILEYYDEYGFTFGGRFSTIGALGTDRLSLALSWGGTKQAMLSATREFEGLAISRLEIDGGFTRRENPAFDLDEDRLGIRGKVTKEIGIFGISGRAGFATIEFGEADDRTIDLGADLIIDTRPEIYFPRNSIRARVGWHGLQVLDGGDFFNQLSLDFEGYLGTIGSTVLKTRAAVDLASESLPDYEKPFLGGQHTLRGYRPGAFVGDNRAHASLEWRIPFTSPLQFGKAGIAVFVDTGTVWDDGESLGQSRFKTGAGAGLFLFAAIVDAELDVGTDFDGGVRVHFTGGLRF